MLDQRQVSDSGNAHAFLVSIDHRGCHMDGARRNHIDKLHPRLKSVIDGRGTGSFLIIYQDERSYLKHGNDFALN
jgi:hypothetical protein